MISAIIGPGKHTDPDRRTYNDVDLCIAGVLRATQDRQILIPWHRVLEVSSDTPGELELALGQ